MGADAVFAARDLAKVYHVGEVEVHALRNVNRDLFAGEFVVILGPSGSGKSTLLNILGGLGDSVDTGRSLGTLVAAAADPATARQINAQLGVAEAALAAARNTEATANRGAAQALRARERTERLWQAGGTSDEQREQARDLEELRRHELDAARAGVTAAAFSRDAARARLPGGGATVRISAPGAGVVLRVDEEHARVVPAGTPLIMIGSLASPEVVVDVLSSDASRIPVGAVMRIASGTDTLSGRVIRVEPTAHTVRSALGVDEQRVSVVADMNKGVVKLGHDFEVRVDGARVRR